MRLTVRLCAFAITIFACFSAHEVIAQPPPVSAGQVIISELRYRGPNGIRDEFIELYNNTNAAIVVNSTSGGWAVVTSNGQITGPVCVIPNGITIPARGHYLCANTDPENGAGYSLSQYPSGNANCGAPQNGNALLPPAFAPTTPNQSFVIDDLPDGFGVALFSTTSGPSQTATTRLDAFGFTSSPALFREGAGFPTVPTVNNEHTLFRGLSSETPRDTGDNASDFALVATTASLQTPLNGSPGPENLCSPIVNNTTIANGLLDPSVSSASVPNREKRPNVEPNANLGSLLIRRRITNNTGAPVSRLRFRAVNITTRGTPANTCPGFNCADLRLLTSSDGEAGVGGQVVTVRGLRLEDDPPITPEGGGLNASVSADFITLSTPLNPGNSVNVVFKLGIMKNGNFRFFVNIEALNTPAPIILD
jgi:hypothetical protein